MYPDISLYIDGGWAKGSGGKTIPVLNPATGDAIGSVAHAEKSDLERAAQAADKGFKAWRKVSAFERYKIMRKAAENLRSRADDVARLMTMEQGKPLAESRAETLAGADLIDWFAEEGRRAYGRVIPARAEATPTSHPVPLRPTLRGPRLPAKAASSSIATISPTIGPA